MGKSFGKSPEERQEYLKELQDMGLQDMRYYFPNPMQTYFGFGATTVDNEKETVETNKVYIEAMNPVIAIATFWESFWQQALVNVIETYCSTIEQALQEKYSGNDIPMEDIVNLLNLLKDEDTYKKAIQTVYSSVPDIMSIGSPYIVNNAVVKSEKEMSAEFKQTVDDLLADVFKDVPNNEEE